MSTARVALHMHCQNLCCSSILKYCILYIFPEAFLMHCISCTVECSIFECESSEEQNTMKTRGIIKSNKPKSQKSFQHCLELMRHSSQLSTYVVICFCIYIVISKKEASQPQVESEGWRGIPLLWCHVNLWNCCHVSWPRCRLGCWCHVNGVPGLHAKPFWRGQIYNQF